MTTGADILARARSYLGRYTDDDADELAREVGQKWPEMASYAALAKNGTHWCGIFCAKVLSEFGIRPPFGSTDVQRWMWVDAWKPFGTSVPVSQRQPGDLCLWLGSPHHIAIYAGGKYVGGNQSDAVTETTFRTPDVVRRAPGVGVEQPVEVDDALVLQPLLVHGDTGPYVEKLQKLLGVEVDGEFGDDTEEAVREFQARHPSLQVDGEVGPLTWAALLGKPPKVSNEPARYLELREEYASQWERMEVTNSEADTIARKLFANKTRYAAASARTLVPWFVIAAWHWREASGNFTTHLHNGDPLTARTFHVPAGRPPSEPPFTWDDSAYDALVTLKALNTVGNWTVERIAYESERYNGWGYRNRGVPSAYVWSFSNIYKGGKYVADGVWSATAVDKQCGVMPMIKQLAKLDTSIVLQSFKDAPEPIDDQPETEPEIVDEEFEVVWKEIKTALRPIIRKHVMANEDRLDRIEAALEKLTAPKSQDERSAAWDVFPGTKTMTGIVGVVATLLGGDKLGLSGDVIWTLVTLFTGWGALGIAGKLERLVKAFTTLKPVLDALAKQK